MGCGFAFLLPFFGALQVFGLVIPRLKVVSGMEGCSPPFQGTPFSNEVRNHMIMFLWGGRNNEETRIIARDVLRVQEDKPTEKIPASSF